MNEGKKETEDGRKERKKVRERNRTGIEYMEL